MAARAIVIGSGLAGLACALTLAEQAEVILLTKTPGLAGGSSLWAQGGIAAALGDGDAPAAHAEDTLAAGDGLSAPGAVAALTAAAPSAIATLAALGVVFDRNPDGSLALGREAAHSQPRIVHAQGDRTGRVVVEALAAAAARHPRIRVLDGAVAVRLIQRDGRVVGVLGHRAGAGWECHAAPAVVLATGGIGALFSHTTNPAEATGDGLALAARAGAALVDLEFVQFHPTALRAEADQLPLLTEALRGAGARLVLADGTALIGARHQQGDLAPRDVVARFIHEAMAAGRDVFLDLRPALASRPEAFPQAIETCLKAGFDPFTQAVPVVPAAHYHMGGIAVDRHGRSSVAGLWACGEAASAGIHGANRLASNSLLEAFVFGRHVAEDILAPPPPAAAVALSCVPPADLTGLPASGDETALRQLLSRDCGLVRDASGLKRAAAQIAVLARRRAVAPPTDHGGIQAAVAFDNALLVARLIVAAAAARTESRGAHARRDHPGAKPSWRCRQLLTLRGDALVTVRQPLQPDRRLRHG